MSIYIAKQKDGPPNCVDLLQEAQGISSECATHLAAIFICVCDNIITTETTQNKSSQKNITGANILLVI